MRNHVCRICGESTPHRESFTVLLTANRVDLQKPNANVVLCGKCRDRVLASLTPPLLRNGVAA